MGDPVLLHLGEDGFGVEDVCRRIIHRKFLPTVIGPT
jgi:hypothetical protein